MVKTANSIFKKSLARAALALLLGVGAKADELQLLWQIPAAADGSTLVGTGNNERGAAINPVTGNVLLVSRTGGNHIYIINGQTGDLIGELNLGDGVIGGGTFPISMIGVADDGAIYAANLATANPPVFKLYRWENETADGPTIAFEGDPAGLNDAGASNNAQRWGDSIDVRGAGAGTQVLIGSNAGTVAAILTTANGTDFTSKLISNAAPSGALGVAFGAGNTFWTKKSGTALRHVSFNLETGAGAVLRNVATTTVPGTVSPIAVHASSNWLAGISINAAADDVRLYDISDPANIFIADQELLPVDQANGNAVGALDFNGEILVALDTNNGLIAYRVVRTVTAPSFVSQPASSSALAGGSVTLSANVAGTRPIDLRWQFNGTDLPNGTNSTLTLTNLTAGSAGEYRLIATNASGSLTSSVARLTIDLPQNPGTLDLLWNLAPGSRSYITQGNTERGLAYNPATGRLLMVSRTGPVGIYVLNPADGAELWQLQAPTDIVAGSNPAGFRLNMIAVADDGAVYAANLDTAGTTYAIYRWENDSADTVPTVAWAGAPVAARRWGDTLAARGAGANTQLLAASNVGTSENTNVVAVFRTADGVNFEAVPISTPSVNDDAFRLGVAFGAGNTFWGKATTFPLTQVQFDLAAGTGTVLRSVTNLPSSSAPIGTQSSSNWLAVVAFQTPDNIRLYDTSGTDGQLTLIDGRALPTDIDNANGTGAVAFAGDRLFVIDTNNGLQAYRIIVSTAGTAATLSSPSRTAGTFSFTLTGSPNAAYRIQASSDFNTWTEVATVTTNAGGTAQVTDNTTQDRRFYRAVAQ